LIVMGSLRLENERFPSAKTGIEKAKKTKRTE
jgi:hypothetical protein